MAGHDPRTEEPSPDATRSPRNTRMHALFDARQGRGLEVGPLHAPVVTRAQGDVRYVDVHDRARLQQIYQEHEGFPVDLIEDPDFVLLGPDDVARPLPQAVGPAAPYDWVVASHVIEHVPDVVTWLSDVAQVLVDDGELVLAVPDRRFCFDVDREPTTVGEMLLAQASGDARPTVRAVYDHYSRCMHIDTERVWNGGAAGPRMYGLDVVRVKMAAAAAGTYVDVHVWVWTAASFVAQLAELSALDLLDFAVEQVVDTAHGDLEFYARLRRLPRALDEQARAARRARGVQAWTDVEPALATVPAPEPPEEPAAVLGSLSPAEAQLVLAKRRWLYEARRRLPFLHP